MDIRRPPSRHFLSPVISLRGFPSQSIHVDRIRMLVAWRRLLTQWQSFVSTQFMWSSDGSKTTRLTTSRKRSPVQWFQRSRYANRRAGSLTPISPTPEHHQFLINKRRISRRGWHDFVRRYRRVVQRLGLIRGARRLERTLPWIEFSLKLLAVYHTKFFRMTLNHANESAIKHVNTLPAAAKSSPIRKQDELIIYRDLPHRAVSPFRHNEKKRETRNEKGKKIGMTTKTWRGFKSVEWE
jgi:hypothetical protein